MPLSLPLSAIILLAVIVAALSAPMFAGTYTVVFQDGRHGYGGTRDAYITSDRGDANIGVQDCFMARRNPKTSFEQRGLVKFTDLNLPADAKVVSAELSLFTKEIRGSPTIAIHGLLKDFTEGTKNYEPADEGQTTWNAVHHGQQPWSQPGAAAESGEFVYDQDADHRTPADDTATINQSGAWYTWNVTASLANQLAEGKPYGWLLRVTNAEEDTFAVFYSRQAMADDAPVSIVPKLTVTYESELADRLPRPLTRAKLILWGGHSAAEPAQLLKDPDRLKAFPFDGVAFPADAVGISVFNPRRMPPDAHADYAKAGRALLEPPSPLTANYLKLNVYPGTLDPTADPSWENRGKFEPKVWYSDFDIVVHNISVASRIAREAGMVGIALDWEVYGANLWKYDEQADMREQNIDLEQARAQVRQCGERFAQAINGEYPNMMLLIVPHAYAGRFGSDYELIRPFLAGVFAAADPRMRIIDGNEDGYYARHIDDFRGLHRRTTGATLSTEELTRKYHRHIAVGFGVWLEKNGWSHQPELNNLTPARWEVTLADALRVADGCVWVFNGGSGSMIPNWWKATGPNVPMVPPAYQDATRRARDAARR